MTAAAAARAAMTRRKAAAFGAREPVVRKTVIAGSQQGVRIRPGLQGGTVGLQDPTWQEAGAAAARRFEAGHPFRFATPGPEFISFAGPGGDTAAASATCCLQFSIPQELSHSAVILVLHTITMLCAEPTHWAFQVIIGSCLQLLRKLCCGWSTAVRGPEQCSARDVNSNSCTGYTDLFEEAAKRLEGLGGTRVPAFDFAPFATAAAMLYETGFLAERYMGVREFLHAATPAETSSAGTPLRLVTVHQRRPDN